MYREAIIDSSRYYRYSLSRVWDSGLGKVTFILLNPSTADDKYDDPAIRKFIELSKEWGCGALEVVNLFAYRFHCIELNKTGCPKHPLYVRKDSSPLQLKWDGSNLLKVAG